MPMLARLLRVPVHLLVLCVLYVAWLLMLAGWLAAWLLTAAHVETSRSVGRAPILPAVALRLAPIGGAR